MFARGVVPAHDDLREGLSQPTTKFARGVVPAHDDLREGLSQPTTNFARGVVPAHDKEIILITDDEHR
jgi:hypothetical protein